MDAPSTPSDSTTDAQPPAERNRLARADTWFVGEVLPLEPALMRLLRRHAQAGDDPADLRQDVYVRLYEHALREGLPASARAFVFASARHLLIDRARRARVVSFDQFAELEDLAEWPYDELTPERLAGARSEMRRLADAVEHLPPRCRQVFELRKIEGLSQREIAAQLGISEGTVEKQVTLGVRAVAEALFAHGVEAAAGWLQRLRPREPDR